MIDVFTYAVVPYSIVAFITTTVVHSHIWYRQQTPLDRNGILTGVVIGLTWPIFMCYWLSR